MAAELRVDVRTLRNDGETLLARIADQRIDQRRGHAPPADFRRNERMIGHPRLSSCTPCQSADGIAAGHGRTVFPLRFVAFVGDFDAV